jgi:hypothetical protein
MAESVCSNHISTSSFSVSGSALAALQSKAVGGALSATDLHNAIASDIGQRLPLSETFLSKFLLATSLSEQERVEIVSSITARMNEVLYSDQALFLNYSKAAVLLAKNRISTL